MIGKITRGSRVGGLLRYLFGPTRFETSPHSDAHLVAAWDGVDGIEPAAADNAVGFDVRQLTALLESPLVYAERVPAKPVWHCSVRAAPTDRMLSDAEWAEIARDVVASVGLAADENRSGVRWVAVRHATDHIHIVATLVREDGTPARLDFDKKALRSACMCIEERYGLRATAPADGTAVLGPSRAEIEKAQRSGRSESVRETLRRHVRTAAAGALTEADFWRRLDTEGVLVRLRISERNPDEITGYSVGLPGGQSEQLDAARTKVGEPVFFSGGKLASDLTLPKLRARWVDEPVPLGELTLRAEDRRRLWRNSISAVAAAERDLRDQATAGRYDQVSDTASAALDVLLLTARVLGRDQIGQHVREAAAHYERAMHEPYARRRPLRPTGERLRISAIMLGAVNVARVTETQEVLVLVRNLMHLIDALRALRSAQGRTFQAAAAVRAQEQLAARGGFEPMYRIAGDDASRRAKFAGRMPKTSPTRSCVK